MPRVLLRWLAAAVSLMVIAGLDPAIQSAQKNWMPGSSPGMTG
jgi:hypothetical protein